MTETELKFGIPAEQFKTVEAAVRRGAVTRTRLLARYFDTADHALARQGIALRLRKEGRRWVQTVKAAGKDAVQRLEHNVDLGASRAGVTPLPDPALHAGTPVGELLERALAAAAAPLEPTYATDIWRLTRLIRIPGGWVELALDSGHIEAVIEGSAKPARTEVRELELELIKGDITQLIALANRWATRHGLWLSTISKAERGERLLYQIALPPLVKAGPTVYETPSPNGHGILQAAVASCLAQMLPNASEIAEGSNDGEQIHQLRIGIRRLRTALRELNPVAPAAIDPAWEAPLVAAFRALGELRDREEVLETAQAQLLAAGGPALELPAVEQAVDAGRIVRNPQFQAAVLDLLRLTLEAPRAADAAPAEPQDADAQAALDEPHEPAAILDAPDALTYLRNRLRRLHNATVRDGRRFAELTPDERHRTRKRLKRLRYLLEFVAPLLDRPSTRDYLQQLRPAQDALGLYNDEVVALETYRQLAAAEPRAWFGVGWFSARQDALVQQSASQLQTLKKAPRFWEK